MKEVADPATDVTVGVHVIFWTTRAAGTATESDAAPAAGEGPTKPLASTANPARPHMDPRSAVLVIARR